MFFIASSSATTQELQRIPEAARWRHFVENKNNGRKVHELTMRQKLLDHNAWQRVNIDLMDMTPEEQAEVLHLFIIIIIITIIVIAIVVTNGFFFFFFFFFLFM